MMFSKRVKQGTKEINQELYNLMKDLNKTIATSHQVCHNLLAG